jgi:uncharacterized protein involved in outer membrane biogenesis
MSGRRWRALAVIVGVFLVGATVALTWLPELVRHAAVARIHALTGRPVSIDRIDLKLLTGRATVHGFRVAERDGQAPFADFERLDLRVRLPSLLFGHLWIRDVVLTGSTVRVVRLATNEFNVSDLIRSSSEPTGRRLDVTVDRFVLTGGTVTLEDRAVPEARTWASEQIAIEAHDLSTRRDDGRAVGRSVTAGAPVTVDVKHLRLYPIHVQASVTVDGLDLTLAQVYLPADAPVVVDRGRATTSVTVVLDARDGIRADARARFEDVAVVRREGGERLALVPHLTTELSGFAYRDQGLRLERLTAEGTMSVRDPTGKQTGGPRLSRVSANVDNLTWPATTPGQLDVLTSIPGGGTLAVAGTLRPPPAPTDLRVRLADLDLTPWAQFLPLRARVTGFAEADLRMNEPLAAGIPARVQGSVAVNRLGVADAREELVRVRRVEASGLTLHWPTRVAVDRVLVSAPRGVVERERDGSFRLGNLVSSPPTAGPADGSGRPAAAPAFGVDIGEIVVRDGAVAWRDETVSPPARLDVSSVVARITGIGWPLRGPAHLRVGLRPPGGGDLQVTGRVGLDPLAADVRLVAKNAALAPYQAYVPTPADVSGAADLDLAVVVPSLAERRATVRGTAALSQVDVRDRQRTVVRVERATAAGIDIDWPEKIDVGRVVLTQPWAAVERDDKGALPLRALLMPRARANAAPAAAAEEAEKGRAAVAVTVARLAVDRGGLRLVDRAVSPAFAVDLQPFTLRVDGLSTVPDTQARVDLAGQLGPGAEFRLRGSVGAIGGPLRLDVNGELREFALPRTNPYLLQQVGWKTTEGRLTSTLRCRIDGDALSAKTDVRLSRLRLVRASPDDAAQARIGLPLNMITALMKDRRGDINLSLPVGGRLGDPRFDYSEAIWSSVRAVAINAITRPVSWIGRVHMTSDSRIERIDVNPIPFEPGAPTPRPDGQEQVTRVAAFLDALPEVKMSLTPIVSSRDLGALRRRSLDATLDRAARDGRLSREAAAARLFEQRLPGRRVPDALEERLAALAAQEPIPPSALAELAAERLEAVRATVKQAGIDPGRLVETKPVQRDDADGQVALEVLEPEGPRPSKFREALRRLGVPLPGANGTE